MTKRNRLSYRWILLPILFSSASVLAGGAGGFGSQAPLPDEQAMALTADEDGFLEDAQAVNSTSMNYVGGNTRIGVGIDTEFKGRIDGRHIFLETEDSVTSGQGWLGIDPTADDEKDEEILTGVGAKVNHHWVTRDADGTPLHVNKVFGAYDQNAAEDKKLSAGYGQERENLFWSGHVSKGLSDKRIVGSTKDAAHIYEKAYDFGVGGRVGTFLGDQLLRMQGGVDYEWGTEQAQHEDTPMQFTVTGGLEKFFPDSPHSVGANIEVSKKSGGYDGDDVDADISGNVSYRYDFGGAGMFASDEQYRRVRVEIPGKTERVQVKKKRAPKVERKLVKHTMELEADTFFKRGEHQLTHDAQQRLGTMIARIRETGHHGNIRITGNTCDLGSDQLNQGLSERRAAQVRSFMVANGFNANELQSRGLGESQPKYPNTEGSRHRNRRVDIEYVTYQNNYKDEVIQQGYEVEEKVRVVSEPRVVWRKELIPSPPTWVGQALRNDIQYKQSIDTYRTLGEGNIPDEENIPPVAIDDQEVMVDDGTAIIDVLSNDTDANGDELSIESFDQQTAEGGTVEQDPDTGNLIYTSVNGFTGTDTFNYVVTDNKGGSDVGTVSVTINQPVPSLEAKDDSATTEMNTPVSIDVLNNDSHTGEGNISIQAFDASSPNGGMIEKADGLLVYTPATDFVGSDTFTYTIEDTAGATASAIVRITVDGPPPPPPFSPLDDSYTVNPVDLDDKGEIQLRVLTNDNYSGAVKIRLGSLPSLGSIQNSTDGEITDDFVTYSPQRGASGTDSFTYTLVNADGEESGTATVTITMPIPPINAQDDGAQGAMPGDLYSFYINDTAPRLLDVLANDIGEGLEIVEIVTTPRFGTAEISEGGQSVRYTLRSGYCEDHSFVYRIRDEEGNESEATVYINILY